MSRIFAVLLALTFATPLTVADGPVLSAAARKRKASIKAGIGWLLQTRNPDKGWGCQEPKTPSSSGLTGLAVLSLMGAGHTPTRGKYSRYVREGVDFILDWGDRYKGKPLTGPYTTPMGAMFDHACALMALSMAHGSYPKQATRIKRHLRDAALLMVMTQNENGGWSGLAGATDANSTAFAWLGLRAAYSGGMMVHSDADKIEKYFATQMPGSSGRLSGNARIGHAAGWLRIAVGTGKTDPAVKKLTEVLYKRFLRSDVPGRVSEWDFIAAALLAQTFKHVGGKAWSEWFPAATKYLYKIQDRDGSWTIRYCLSCRTLGTTLALLTLETPDARMPLFDL